MSVEGKWLNFVDRWKDCQRCPLAKQRSLICLARGTLPCEVLLIGEAPGVNEDATGEPFVGPAGQRLNQIIERALPGGVTHALINLVACFPREAKARGDNEPERGEILECRPRVIEFVNLAQPRLIVCVGGLAAGYISHTDTVKCVDIVHPAHILRMPLAQQTMATNKCVVQITNAYVSVLQSPKLFQTWGVSYGKSEREHLRQVYGASGDGIPY